MENISNRILNVINDANLSYGELSKLTQIPKSALQRYATGETKIPIDRVEKIAKATNVSAAFLMGWESNEVYAKTKNDMILLKKYSLLSESNKQAVLTLIDNLLDGQSS